MKSAFLISLILLAAVTVSGQDYEELIFELSPSRTRQCKFTLDKSARTVALWTSYNKDRTVWEHKDMITLPNADFEELLFRLDSVDFTVMPDTSKRGFDGTWYYVTLKSKGQEIRHSAVWSKYKTTEHERLWRIMVTQLNGKFTDEEIVDFLENKASDYE